MHLHKMNDIIEPKIRFTVDESASDVDGQHILAKVKGEFFFPDGKSRNQRFYPKKLWENVIDDPEVRQKLKKRIMFGTVGHDAEMNDKAIRDGLISHFMSDIKIENGKGIGEAYILNTPVGKILNTILRAGCEVCVSSRADGKFRGTTDGLETVDPDNFQLIGWDFVIDPGFLQANPKIAESFNTVLNSEGVGGNMSEMQKLVEHITEENGELKKANAELTTDNSALKETNKELAAENDHMKQEVSKAEEAYTKLKAYEALGSPEDIEKALDVAEESADQLKDYQALGTPEKIKEAFSKTKTFTESFKQNFGSVRQVSEALKLAESTGERLAKLGTLPQIEKIVEEFEQMVADKEAEIEKKKVEEQEKAEQDLAAEVGAEKEEIKEMLKKNSPDEIRAIYKKISEAVAKKAKPAPAVAPVNEAAMGNNPWVKRDSAPASESTSIVESSILSKSVLDRVNERLSK